MRRGSRAFIVTCEHASRAIPVACRAYFRSAGELVRSHRGYDIGARCLAETLATTLGAGLSLGRATRLLVDLNRSPTSRACFSECTRGLPASVKAEILDRWHRPWRETVLRRISDLIKSGSGVTHLSVHTFTPVLDGCVRTADVGLLYDSARSAEAALAAAWRRRLIVGDSTLRVRRNYPYRGSSDGTTRWLRTQFPDGRYVGIELEVNQRFPVAGGAPWRRLQALLSGTLPTAAFD